MRMRCRNSSRSAAARAISCWRASWLCSCAVSSDNSPQPAAAGSAPSSDGSPPAIARLRPRRCEAMAWSSQSAQPTASATQQERRRSTARRRTRAASKSGSPGAGPGEQPDDGRRAGDAAQQRAEPEAQAEAGPGVDHARGRGAGDGGGRRRVSRMEVEAGCWVTTRVLASDMPRRRPRRPRRRGVPAGRLQGATPPACRAGRLPSPCGGEGSGPRLSISLSKGCSHRLRLRGGRAATARRHRAGAAADPARTAPEPPFRQARLRQITPGTEAPDHPERPRSPQLQAAASRARPAPPWHDGCRSPSRRKIPVWSMEATSRRTPASPRTRPQGGARHGSSTRRPDQGDAPQPPADLPLHHQLPALQPHRDRAWSRTRTATTRTWTSTSPTCSTRSSTPSTSSSRRSSCRATTWTCSGAWPARPTRASST